MIWEKDIYLNKTIPYMISREIIEYDIRSAGFNLIKKYKLLPQNKIDHLEKQDKKQRQILIGLYERSDPELKQTLKDSFKDIRRIFFEANDIDTDDIVSIKKDAIFSLKHCDNRIFDNVEFVEKNVYTSYYYINKLEFYVGQNSVDVKGINDEKLRLHEDYMLDFMFKIFKMMETTSSDVIIKSLKEFTKYYKAGSLEIGYYRELNKDSLFKLNKTLMDTMIGVHDTTTLDGIDTSYNFTHYIIPLVNLMV